MSVTPPVFPLLRLLADGEYRTGAALAAALGVAPSAIRRQLDAAERFGVRLQRVPGRGCRLAGALDLLDPGQLRRALRGACAVEVLDECPSTNTVLMERARNGTNQALALACEYQTAGRGRRGKRWQSGIGTDLTFSVLWWFPRGAATLSGLSLAVGVALVRALGNLGHGGVQLKWPNDLMLRGRKLGGILIEVSGGHGSPAAAVIGVGLNVRWDEGRDAVVDQPATGLSQGAGAARTRTALLAGLLLELHAALDLFGRSGFAPFRNEWLEHHAWQGRQVVLRSADGDAAQNVAEGEAMGVAEDGALLLRSPQGIRSYHSGELRLASG